MRHSAQCGISVKFDGDDPNAFRLAVWDIEDLKSQLSEKALNDFDFAQNQSSTSHRVDAPQYKTSTWERVPAPSPEIWSRVSKRRSLHLGALPLSNRISLQVHRIGMPFPLLPRIAAP